MRKITTQPSTATPRQRGTKKLNAITVQELIVTCIDGIAEIPLPAPKLPVE